MKQKYTLAKWRLWCLIVAATCVSIFSCNTSHSQNNQHLPIKPKGTVPKWGPDITPQMQTVIEALDSLNSVPFVTLTPQEVRLKPSFADAYMQVMKNYNIPMPPMNVDTTGKEIAVMDGTIHLRIYTPKSGKSSYPVIVYYHGGGWVIATIDTYNSSAQALAKMADAIVVAVEYRKGPEFKFPTAHNDAFAAYKWTIQHSDSLKGNVNKIALAGESAGGNLAVSVAMMARDSGIRMPVHVISVYPIAGYDFNTPSYQKYVAAVPLNTPLMEWFFKYYLNSPSDGSNPLISIDKANLKGLPPTTVIGAELGPLQSEGKILADQLNKDGVPVVYKLYKGVTHEFFGMSEVVPEAKQAEKLAASELRKAFGN
jgi:acetyl esterase